MSLRVPTFATVVAIALITGLQKVDCQRPSFPSQYVVLAKCIKKWADCYHIAALPLEDFFYYLLIIVTIHNDGIMHNTYNNM